MNIIKTNWNWTGVLSNRASTDYIVLHHAEASSCTAADVDRWHKANKWIGIGYHFFVRKDGSIYEGRPLWSMGAHVSGKNNCSIGVCAEGKYTSETMPLTQKTAICELLVYLKEMYPQAQIVGHKEIGESDCPGSKYPLADIKKNYVKYANKRTEADEVTREEFQELYNKLTAVDDSLTNLYNIVRNLAERMDKIENPMIYNYIDKNMPEWAHEGVQYCIDKGIISGTDENKLGLDDKDLKLCTMLMRVLQAK